MRFLMIKKASKYKYMFLLIKNEINDFCPETKFTMRSAQIRLKTDTRTDNQPKGSRRLLF